MNIKCSLGIDDDEVSDANEGDIMTEDGYVKFHAQRIKDDKAVTDAGIAKLNEWRTKMYLMKLIGMYDNGIGFGNISQKTFSSPIHFIISGTQTGKFRTLTKDQYVLVTDYDFSSNFLECKGMIDASSESMTHAAIYESDEKIGAVIHIHNLELWKNLLHKVPTTKNVPYGTPEMAYEMIRLLKEDITKEKKIIVMSGHEEGIVVFGKDLDEAGKILLDYYQKYK